MKVLVINCGSSSLKYQLIDMSNEESMCQGLVERIGIEGSVLTQKVAGKDKYIVKVPMENHKDAIKIVLEALVDEKNGVITSMDEISAVGHRVVHGGEKYSNSVVITEEVLNSIKDCIALDGERFEYEINMLIEAVKNKIKISEPTIETIYFNNNSETHFRPVKDSLKIYNVMFKKFFK